MVRIFAFALAILLSSEVAAQFSSGPHYGDIGGFGLVAAGGASDFRPIAGGQPATIFADFATEGSGNHYWGNGAARAGFAAWVTSLGGTYSRASTATYNAAGVVQTAAANTPRFPTDIYGNPLGIRLTGAVTNLITYSNAQDNAAWVKTNSNANNIGGYGPDNGTLNAYVLQDTATATSHYISMPSVTYTATSYTVSIWGTRSQIGQLVIGQGNAATPTTGIGCDIQYGGNFLVSGVTAPSAYGIIPFGAGAASNPWFLCWATFTYASGGTGPLASFYLYRGSISYTGDGSQLAIWGAQATQTSYLQDFVPTGATNPPQAADNLSFPYGQTTFSALVATNGQIGNGGILLGGAQANVAALIWIPNATQFDSHNGVQLSGPIITNVANFNKTMVAGSPSGRSITSDGLAPNSDAGALLSPAPTALAVGNYASGATQPTYGNVSQLAIWNGVVASTADMQHLTSPSTSVLASNFSCPSGFVSSTTPVTCGVNFGVGNTGGTFGTFGAQGSWNPALSGSYVELVLAEAVHVALNLNFSQIVNVQQFSTTMRFIPNGNNISFVLSNNTETPQAGIGMAFSAGAGCEGSFFQGFTGGLPTPNNLFALMFDQYGGNVHASGTFSYSSVQFYGGSNTALVNAPTDGPGQSPCNPDGGSNAVPFTYVGVDKISTSPVPLNNPANMLNTTTGDIYQTTIAYDGSTLSVSLYDVTAGGSCPGASCFTHSWSNVNIPSMVGGSTQAWAGIASATGGCTVGISCPPSPLYIVSWSYSGLGAGWSP